MILYYRKASSAEWEQKYYTGYANGKVTLKGLQDSTEYEYKIGHGASSTTPINELMSLQEGRFTTHEETRKIWVLSVVPKMAGVSITCSFGGMEDSAADDTYLVCWCRPVVKGTEQTSWRFGTSSRVSKSSTKAEFRFNNLTKETEYEYRIGFGRDSGVYANELGAVIEGSFTTTSDVRKASEVKADVKETSVILNSFFEGNIEPQASYVIFFYKTKEEKNLHKAGYVTNASSVESRECSATLTELVRDTEYNFAAVVADSSSGVSDPDSVTDTNKKATGEFKTTPAVAPVSVTLLQENLYLNAGETYRNEKGYGYEELKVSWSPGLRP